MKEVEFSAKDGAEYQKVMAESKQKNLKPDGSCRNCWIVEWFKEDMPLENKYGTTMYPLLNSMADPPEIYQDNDKVQVAPPMSVLVFADSYGFATGCLKYAPQERIGRKAVISTPPGQLTRKKIDELLADTWDLIIYAYGIDEPKSNDCEVILQRQTDVIQCAFNICQAIGNDKNLCSSMAVLTCDTFSEEREIWEELGPGNTAAGALFGFTNTARQEVDIPMQYIDVEFSLPETMMPVLSSEVFRISTFGQASTRILKTGRYVMKQVQPFPEYTKAKKPFTLPDSGVIAISGGNGAVALVIGDWLVRQAGAQGCKNIEIKFLSRSAKINDQNLPNWKKCQANAEKYGVKVSQEVNDASKPEQVYAFAEQHADSLIGYVHSAGVLADSMLFNLDWEKFEYVFQPKNRAALHLHFAFEKYGCPIKFYWMFSSTAVYGNMGQLNYSSSNAHMDAIARYRRAIGKNAMVIQWGAWGEVGMAANLDDNSKRRMAQSPMPPFANHQGLDGLENLIASGVAYGSCYGINPDILQYIGMQADTHAAKYQRNFYEHVAPPQPPTSLKMDDAYLIYRALQGPSQPRKETGLVYKYYVKPVVDPYDEYDEDE